MADNEVTVVGIWSSTEKPVSDLGGSCFVCFFEGPLSCV